MNVARQHVAHARVRWANVIGQRPQPRWQLVLGVLGIAVLLATTFAVAATSSRWSTIGPLGSHGSDTDDHHVAYALLVDDTLAPKTYTSEVVAFDEVTGAIVHRLDAGQDPNVILNASGAKLYLLETIWDASVTPMRGTERLSLIDTATWGEIASTSKDVNPALIGNRVQYTIGGPPVMTLTPDGTRVLVYSTDMLGNYWFEIYDAATLAHLATSDRAALRGCGATPVVTTHSDVVVLCGSTKEGSDTSGLISMPTSLQFLDPGTGTVVASLALPDTGLLMQGKPVNIMVSDDDARIYVVFNDLRIMEVDATTRQVRRDITDLVTDSVMVYAAELSTDGHLLIGTAADITSWTDVTIVRIPLAELAAAGLALADFPAAPAQAYPRFAAGPDGDLYQWERGTTRLQRFDPVGGAVLDLDFGGDKTLIAGIVR